MDICKEDDEQYKEAKYCPICSYRSENDLLKESVKNLNEQILKLTQPQ